MYHVELVPEAEAQVDELPADALPAFAELQVLLEVDPWAGDPYDVRKPDGAMRSQVFGTAGLVVYVILERERLVHVVHLTWAG